MTNKKLAEMLHISPSGLSLVLNNRPGVADATRQRILAELDELGYSHLVRRRVKHSGNICFVVYKRMNELFVQYPFFLMLMEGMEERAQRYGWNLVLFHMHGKEPMEPQLEKLRSTDAKGIVIFAPEMREEDVTMFSHMDIPVVYVDNSLPMTDVTSVAINNCMGTHQAISHLVEQGHKSIGYLRSRIRIRNFDEREKLYAQALHNYGLTLLPEHIYTMRFSEQESYIDFSAILREHHPLPTALVADDDTLAIGAHKAIRDAGLRIPDDIAIIGFNNRSCCTLMDPQVSSVYAPPNFYGATAIDSVMKILKDDDKCAFKTMVNTRIIKRGSSLKPPAD